MSIYNSCKNILVIGASGGIGKEVVKYMLSNTNYKIYGTYHNTSTKLDDILQERFSKYNLDITNLLSIENLRVFYQKWISFLIVQVSYILKMGIYLKIQRI